MVLARAAVWRPVVLLLLRTASSLPAAAAAAAAATAVAGGAAGPRSVARQVAFASPPRIAGARRRLVQMQSQASDIKVVVGVSEEEDIIKKVNRGRALSSLAVGAGRQLY